jgi:serine/threonine-protein kinase
MSSYPWRVTASGTVIGGRFRVDQLLGSGGMGIVVAATHLELGHRVAIKVLRDDMAKVPTVVERFLREARAAVRLRTEHVCRVFDVGRTDAGAPYMVMELLEGNDLGRVVATQPLAMPIAVEYVMQACVAVAEAHAAGIIHRDLKPANLVVTRRLGGGPLIKVLDFGIAKAMTEASAQLTHSQSMLGSPAYISPEQLRSPRDVDARTDVWALGATLYQLLTGRLPFHAQTVTAMAVRIMTQPPDPLDTDPTLRAVILRCLDKSPAQRYPDVGALVTDLAPFGGPSGRAIAGMVLHLLHGFVAAQAPVSPLAGTAAAPVAPSALPPPVATAAPTVPRLATVAAPPEPPRAYAADSRTRGESAPDPAALYGTATRGRVAGARRRAWWWITVPLVVVASASIALIAGRRDTPPAAPGSAAVVAASEPPAAPPIDAGAAGSAALAPADAGIPWWFPPENPPRDARKDTRPKDTHAGGANPGAPGKDAAGHTAPDGAGHEPTRPTSAGSVAGSVRDARNTCLESAADTPWNTAMCWCAKKDKARAQAFYAKLSGFKRITVRTFCSARGIALAP